MFRKLMTAVLAGMIAACAQSQDASLDGAELFADHCAACHGALGEGDGPVAGVMQITVPNLRTLSQRNGGDFPAESVRAFIDGRNLPASHGDRYMPVWGNVLRWPDGQDGQSDGETERLVQARIDALVAYLEQIQY
jgi:mono/diheme cytochrome c family protein